MTDDRYFDRTKYKKLIQKAIGNMTQKDFAEFAGISKYNLNNMLNDDDCPVPRKSTLNKIADASRGAVTFTQLLYACGYEIQERPELIENYDYEDMNVEIAEKYKNALIRISNTPLKYDSISNFLETVSLTDGLGNMRFHVLENDTDESIKFVGHRNAEKFIHCYVNWTYGGRYPSKDVFDGFLYFTVFYCKTEGGGYIISDLAFDLNTLMELRHPKADLFTMLMAQKSDINYTDFPMVFYLRKHVPGEAERRLLKAIFGDDEEDD